MRDKRREKTYKRRRRRGVRWRLRGATTGRLGRAAAWVATRGDEGRRRREEKPRRDTNKLRRRRLSQPFILANSDGK